MKFNPTDSTAGAEIVLKSTCWNTFWWIFSSLSLVLATPYCIAKAMCRIKVHRNRDTLPGKVSGEILKKKKPSTVTVID